MRTVIRRSIPGLVLMGAYACWVLMCFPWLGFHELDVDEGFNLGKAALVHAGHGLYQDIWSDQPPVLTLVLAGLQHVVPWSVEAARLLILFSAGVLLVSLHGLVRRTHGWQAAAWSVLLLATAPLFVQLSVSVMIGLPAIALATAALNVATRGGLPWRLGPVIAGVLFALSLQTKFFTVLMGPALVMALLIKRDGKGGGEGRDLIVWGLTCLLSFAAIAIVAGQAFVEQLIYPHFSPALREAFSVQNSARAIWLILSDQHAVLVTGGLGLVVVSKRWLREAWVPVLWLVVAVVAWLFHSPVWYHHMLIMLVPLAWLGGLGLTSIMNGLQARSGPAGTPVAIACAAVVMVLLARLALVDRPEEPAAVLKATAGDAVRRFSGLGGWLVTDTPLDAFRAGLLVPPELVVYSRKRIAVGQLTPEDVLESIRRRHPVQVSFRRLDVDPSILAYLGEHYLLTQHGEGHWHYLARHGHAPPVPQRSAQLLLSDLVQDLTALGVEGGYAGITSVDGGARFGEELNEPLGPRSVFMRPLGSTPRVGGCFLNAYHLTQGDRYLQLSRETARAVARTQHCTGAWASDASDTPDCKDPRNRSMKGLTLDEGMVAEAISFLMDVRAVSPQDHTWLDPVLVKALDFLVATQKPNGAWPFNFSEEPYASHATINDDLTTGHLRALLKGHQLFGHQRHAAAVEKAVAFLLRSQSPQGGWAQQYNDQGEAVAARSFEPAALSTIETAYVIRALMAMDRDHPDVRVRASIQRAASWLQKVRLAPGRWARFHHVRTGKPIYADREGKIYDSFGELPAKGRDDYRWEGHFPDVAHAIAVAVALNTNAPEALRRAEEHSAALARAEDQSRVLRQLASLEPGQPLPLANAQGLVSTRHAIDQCRWVQSLLRSLPPLASAQAGYWPP